MVAIVFLDANFIYTPLQLRIDIFSEIPKVLEEKTELIVLSAVIKEIKDKRKRHPSKNEARLIDSVLNLLNLKIREGATRVLEVEMNEANVDDHILNFAKLLRTRNGEKIARRYFHHPITGIFIATNDALLRKKCRRAGIPAIFVRQRSHLAID
ncbi:MAG: PIN domain-containing protein [Promethearchaeota archaeon]